MRTAGLPSLLDGMDGELIIEHLIRSNSEGTCSKAGDHEKHQMKTMPLPELLWLNLNLLSVLTETILVWVARTLLCSKKEI